MTSIPPDLHTRRATRKLHLMALTAAIIVLGLCINQAAGEHPDCQYTEGRC